MPAKRPKLLLVPKGRLDLEKLDEFLHRKASLPKNGAKCAALDISARMNGNSDRSPYIA